MLNVGRSRHPRIFTRDWFLLDTGKSRIYQSIWILYWLKFLIFAVHHNCEDGIIVRLSRGYCKWTNPHVDGDFRLMAGSKHFASGYELRGFVKWGRSARLAADASR